MHRKSKLQQFQGLETNYDSDSSGGEDLFSTNNAPVARAKNPVMLQRVKTAIENIKHRRLTMNEQVSLRNFISSLPAAKLAYYNDEDIEKNIVNNWLKGQMALNNESGIIDTHELLKKNIGLNSENDSIISTINKSQLNVVQPNKIDLHSVLGNNDSYSIQKTLNPQALYAKTQILLDSRWRSLETDGTLLFKWSFSNNMVTQQGVFNTIAVIRDIIAIKVFPFKIPYNSNVENPTKNITMYYSEFSNQCVPAQENRKYHHWMDYTIEDDWVTINAEKYNKGVYHFEKPITTLDALSINFGAPLKIIQFDADRLDATFTAGSPTIITFASNHNLDTGHTIYFTNFTTTDTVADALIISAMNSSNGLRIIRIDATNISVTVDTSGVAGNMNSPSAFFGEKRIYIPLEITYIKPKYQT